MTVGTEARAHGAEASTARVDLDQAPSTAQVHLLDSEVDLEERGRTSENTWDIQARVGFVGNPLAKVALTGEDTAITGAKVVTALGAHIAVGIATEQITSIQVYLINYRSKSLMISSVKSTCRSPVPNLLASHRPYKVSICHLFPKALDRLCSFALF